jgi:hypothetical protein
MKKMSSDAERHYEEHFGSELYKKCAICLGGPDDHIEHCHIIERGVKRKVSAFHVEDTLFFTLEKLLRFLESAWGFDANTYRQDSKWDLMRCSFSVNATSFALSYVLVLAVCSNWHKEFDRGGWTMLPDVKLLNEIQETSVSYKEWIEARAAQYVDYG